MLPKTSTRYHRDEQKSKNETKSRLRFSMSHIDRIIYSCPVQLQILENLYKESVELIPSVPKEVVVEP